MPDFPTSDYIHLTGSISGGNLTVTSITGDAVFAASVFDADSSNSVTSGDYWAITDYMYSGFTVTVNGNEYALFESVPSPGNFYLPHNGEISYTDLGITAVGQSFPVTADSDANVINCFTGDALIATPTGEVRIDALAIGDSVLTADGRDVPVLWIGRQKLSAMQLAQRSGLIAVAAGAFGPGRPDRELTLTGDHGLIVDGLLINASVLVNGGGIRHAPAEKFAEGITVYHVETPDHEVILANGIPAESFVDYLGRKSFDNTQDYLDLYGAERVIREMPGPRISTRRMLPERIRARLGLTEEPVELAQSA